MAQKQRYVYTVSLSRSGGELESNIQFVAQQLKISLVGVLTQICVGHLDRCILSNNAILMVFFICPQIHLGRHLGRQIWNKTGLAPTKTCTKKCTSKCIELSLQYVLWSSMITARSYYVKIVWNSNSFQLVISHNFNKCRRNCVKLIDEIVWNECVRVKLEIVSNNFIQYFKELHSISYNIIYINSISTNCTH